MAGSARVLTWLKGVLLLGALAVLGGCTSGNSYVTQADRNEIITVGDSIFDLSGELQQFLEQKAGQTFRDYTLSGAELAGGLFATPINQQYVDAREDDPNIETVVMDGGGNDILIPAIVFDPYGCRTHWWRWNISSACKNLINDVYVDGVDLLNEMAQDGVQNVIYLGYYHTKGLQANLAKAVDYGDSRLADACANTWAQCTFVDPRPVINKGDIIIDGIHPATSGSAKLADLIWPYLQPLL
ncbi:MAG: SGNH/GDSL hydrolase family protein [Gammaproteobacteria bacterium]|nr:MAG: SGNH/GDSL hydrolase family protein [Gammaproteobacteria bacterium]